MPKAHNVLIHEFHIAGVPVYYDDEGDQMLGFYFQFTDEADQPISALIGPYGKGREAERAARRAFDEGEI